MDGDLLQHGDDAAAPPQPGEDVWAPPRRRFFALAGAAAGAIPLAGGPVRGPAAVGRAAAGQPPVRRRGGPGRAGHGRLGGAAPGAVHAQPGPPRPAFLRDGQGTLRPPVRRAAPGRHRLLRHSAGREHLPGLRAEVRAAGGGTVRRAQLRRVVQHQWRPHRGRHRDELLPGDRRDRSRSAPGLRLIDMYQRLARARPGRAGRVVRHGRRGRADPGRRSRRAVPRLRPGQRQPPGGPDRDRGRPGPHLHGRPEQ